MNEREKSLTYKRLNQDAERRNDNLRRKQEHKMRIEQEQLQRYFKPKINSSIKDNRWGKSRGTEHNLYAPTEASLKKFDSGTMIAIYS